eukprot:5608667-Amphidinium_carterae.1
MQIDGYLKRRISHKTKLNASTRPVSPSILRAWPNKNNVPKHTTSDIAVEVLSVLPWTLLLVI